MGLMIDESEQIVTYNVAGNTLEWALIISPAKPEVFRSYSERGTPDG